jgi:RNA ligase (TIGR02306 family)
MNEATVQKITDIKPVENSDFLDCVSVLGWKVVVHRGEYNVGDACVYISIDTIVPETEPFEFLRDTHFRVRTKKLRGQISQGLLLPLSILPEGLRNSALPGDDVSSILGVTHYEKPVPCSLSGQAKGNFPSCVSKTDELRLQSYLGVLDELDGVEVYSSVKCDGTSFTAIYNDGMFDVCSRTRALKIDDDTSKYVEIAKRYNLQEKMSIYGKNIAIQAELCGPSIQKNRLNLKEYELFVFNVYDIDKQELYSIYDMIILCNNFGLKTVTIEKVFIFDKKVYTLEYLLEIANGTYIGTKNLREGIVIRPVKPMFSKVLRGRMSFKVLNNEYLIRNKE